MGSLDICSLGKILKSSCLVGRHRKFYKTEVDDITLQELELLKVKTRTDSSPFMRGMRSHVHASTHTKVFRRVMSHMRK